MISIGRHENILGVLGVCSSEEEENSDDNAAAPTAPVLVMEYMEYGDLLHLLWNARDVGYLLNTCYSFKIPIG